MNEIIKEAFEIWKAQGRTEEQIWAVENFLTGAGWIGIEKVYQEGKEDGMIEEAIGCNTHCEKEWNAALEACYKAMPGKKGNEEQFIEGYCALFHWNDYRSEALQAIKALKK